MTGLRATRDFQNMARNNSLKYLNLGCGRRYHPDWTNLDFRSTGEGVIAHDLTQGIPFPGESCDVVYHSHLLEHFTPEAGARLLRECYRVLRPGGIIRVAVPDLEQIAHLYIHALEKADAGDRLWQKRYDWIMLELYDQTVRNTPGGRMKEYLSQVDIPEKDFIVERLGGEAANLISKADERREQKQSKLHRIRRNIFRLSAYSARARNGILRVLLGKKGYRAHQVGSFRLSGEVHQWMYDRYSLSTVLKEVGFETVEQMTARTSNIPNWSTYNLDTDAGGGVCKPDSLFMEGVKKEV